MSLLKLDADSVRMGALATIPVAMSVFAYGMVYGLLTRQAAMSWTEAILSSGLVFAGSAQFVALDMWSHPLPVGALIFTIFIVNLRHLLMGAALTPWLGGLPLRTSGLLFFFMSDESWALTYGALNRGKCGPGFLLGSGLLVWGAWLAATLTGRAVGAAIPDPGRFGLDFAFTAVFLALLAGLWKGRRDIPAWLVATATSLAVYHLVPGKWYIVAGGLAGSLTGLWRGNAAR